MRGGHLGAALAADIALKQLKRLLRRGRSYRMPGPSWQEGGHVSLDRRSAAQTFLHHGRVSAAMQLTGD